MKTILKFLFAYLVEEKIQFYEEDHIKAFSKLQRNTLFKLTIRIKQRTVKKLFLI